MPSRIPPFLYVLALLAAMTAGFRLLAPAPEGIGVGAPAPDFRLADIRGGSAALSDYRGGVVLLDFWATWCDTCRSELPSLKALNAKFQDEDFRLVAPSVDDANPREVAAFAAAHALPYQVLLADYPTLRRYRVSGLPAKFLIGRDGTVAARYIGPSDPARLEKDIEKLIQGLPLGS